LADHRDSVDLSHTALEYCGLPSLIGLAAFVIQIILLHVRELTEKSGPSANRLT
jgi:hypothetical protein